MKNTICTYDEDTKLNYKIHDLISQSLNGLDRFLKDLKAKIPESFLTTVEYLNDFYEKIEIFDVSFKSDFEILNQHPALVNGSKNHVLSLVNYSKYNSSSINDEIEIYTLDIVRVFTHFEYCLMESLLKIMSRDEAIEYIKNLSDEVSLSRRNPDNYVNSFEESTERFKNNLGRWRMQESVSGPLDEARLLYKVKRCEWAEALKDFDSELCYAMLCYSDFQGAQNLNPNFILTRTKTLMKGDEYCDFCYHDTRKDKDLSHPPESEFEELG